MSPKVAGATMANMTNITMAMLVSVSKHIIGLLLTKSTYNFSKLIKAQSTQKHDSYHSNDCHRLVNI